MLSRHEENPQENNNAEARSQQSRFVVLLKSHPRTDTHPRKFAAHPQNTSSGGLLLHVKTILKDLNYEKFLSEVVKGYLHYKTILCHKVALDV